MKFTRRQVGRTAIHTSHVGFGCGGIGNRGSDVTDADAQALLQHALDNGLTYFDTAPHYGRGRSEARLGAFLRKNRKANVTISTKVGRVLTPGLHLAEADGFLNPLPNDVRYDYTGDGIEESLAGSMQRLGREFIDIVFIHDIGPYTHGVENPWHMDDLLSSGLPRLRKLKAEGKIGAIGLGVNETAVCLEVLANSDLDVILLAGRWTLLDRSAEKALVPLCRERGVSLILGGIFNSGILATGPEPGARYNYAPASEAVRERARLLQAEADAAGLTLPQAAMQFAISRDQTCSVLIGTSKLSSLKRNLEMLGKPMPASTASSFGDTVY